eukprot:gene14473-19428_t
MHELNTPLLELTESRVVITENRGKNEKYQQISPKTRPRRPSDGSMSSLTSTESRRKLVKSASERMSLSVMPSVFPDVITTEDNKVDSEKAGNYYNEHLFSLETLAIHFKTGINLSDVSRSIGLTTLMALTLLNENGRNVLTPPPRVPLWLLFLLQFTNLLIILLLIVAFISIILFIVQPTEYYQLYLGVLLLIVIFVTCYETFSQEAKADSLMEKFRALVPSQAAVIRDVVIKFLQIVELFSIKVCRLINP